MEYVLNVIGVPTTSLKKAFFPLVVFGRHVHDHFIPHARNNYHPHVLAHRNLALMSGLMVMVKIFTIALMSFGPIAPAFSSAITEQNIITLTNESRQQFGVASLTENSILDKAAQAKADDMLAKGYFAHNSPDGRTPWDFITAAGYSYLMAGENLAVNFTEAENVETAWMNSPGHKANILNKNFQDIGIGISQGTYQDHTAIFVVQEFGLAAVQPVALTNTPTQVQTSDVPAPAAAPAEPQAVAPAPSQVKSASAPTVAKPPAQPVNDIRSASAAAAPLPVEVSEGSVQLVGSNVQINAQVSGPAIKVLAYFGQQAVMLSPKSDTSWTGQVAASVLAQTDSMVKLEAFGMQGQSAQLQLADFSNTTQSNYNLAATTPVSTVTFLGQTFDPKSAESRFYMLFIAGLLSCLVLAIAIKKHIQHLPLIANSSFVVILACLLWMAG